MANAGGSFSDMFFGFLDEDHPDHQYGVLALPDHHRSSTSYESLESDDHGLDQEEADHHQDRREEKDNAFWENQHQLLQGTLRRTSCLETGIRNVVKEVVRELQVPGRVCGCGKAAMSCRECLIREVSGRVGQAGYNCAVCKTKWRSSPDIPSGEHMFLDVVEKNYRKKGEEEVRVIIEVKMRAEFEVARASDEYERLLRRLPEVFVGKEERMRAVIKLMCAAAKKCMRDKNMHMGPWRKHSYMHAKWLAPSRRAPPSPACPAFSSPTPPTARPLNAPSLLTLDLLLDPTPYANTSNNANMHCNAVAVV